MRKILFIIALLWAAPAMAQPQVAATPVRLVDPVSGVSVYPFGQVVFGTTTPTRGGLIGCATNASEPTYTNGQFNPCSMTTDGKVRVENGYVHGTTSTVTDKVTMMGCVRNDGITALANDGQRSRIQCDDTGAIKMSGTFSLATGATIDIGNVGASALPSGAATSAKQPALGTAGSPSPDFISVQGSSSMTPLEFYLTDASGAYIALAQDGVQGQTAPTGGPMSMGECDDTSTVAVTEGQAGKARIDCTTRAHWVRTADPCSGKKSVFVINISTATTTEAINGAGAANNVYICSVAIGPTAGVQNIALVEDDTDNCASPTAGLAGGTTAASGWNIAANGGTNFGGGNSTVAQTTGLNRYVCFISSASQQASGTMTYVLAP